MESPEAVIEEQEKAQEQEVQQQIKGKPWFKVGDLIEVRGFVFRIKSVKPLELRLKLIPRRNYDIEPVATPTPDQKV
jgi:uncharacterized Zn finger protein